MMKLIDQKVKYVKGSVVPLEDGEAFDRSLTLSGRILAAHSTGADGMYHIRFDSLTSHDITYVNIIQTARASGLTKFPMPYVLTNCHNTLCAVGGTINEDDHRFALSAAHKYGGIYVPPCLAVIHSYNREMMTGCGKMILGSDSHTRYGALGTMGIGEGGGELVKQLINQTYDLSQPQVILVHVTGKVKPGIGPHDVALALVGAVYHSGFVRNKVLEFVGEGIHGLSQDFRNGIDVMTTETACLSSIWETDQETQRYYQIHGREEDYRQLSVAEGACYDGAIELDLSEISSMIALPMHPSYAVRISDLKEHPYELLKEAQDRSNRQLNGVTMDLVSKIDDRGRIHVDQGIIAGCSGGIYENICAAAHILKNGDCGNGEFRLSVYPDSLPVYFALARNGVLADVTASGAIVREAFCGPCFGAGETPANGEFSIRHTTRNFPNREGSKPAEGQIAAVGLMDARSIAATARNQGILTGADELGEEAVYEVPPFTFDQGIYEKRVYNGWGKAEPETELVFGPNIKDWPEIPALSDDLLLKVVTYIDDPVTTTDELIPSGETSSFRSNPLRLAQFALGRRDPQYVSKAEAVAKLDAMRRASKTEAESEKVYAALNSSGVATSAADTLIESCIYANKPGDGSAREQAASCQRVPGGGANIAQEYATKRYRTNCINWGIVPFETKMPDAFKEGDWIFVKGIRESLEKNTPVKAYVVESDGSVSPLALTYGTLDEQEKETLLAGCLINYNRNRIKH
ncbi:MAG: hydratase [Galactobacillus timonensis]|uniref:hydratase n=1 Tax=Galactobacillus timonensis TaxID=2041840 RepID=UPI002409CC73|nr:hydratase [Galactobacillus timonensis]MDD6599366.1 hydratase [Galactobacillus timonensis]